MKKFDTENAETICLELIIVKKVVHYFCLPTLETNKVMFFDEIYITLNITLGKYDNITLAGDLNIDGFKTGSHSSTQLSDAKDVFNFTNLLRELLFLDCKMEILLT